MQNTALLTVYYDGACPLCRREIAFYQARAGARELAWIDVSQAVEEEVSPGLSRCDALARFHTRRSDGTLVSGGAAFAELWAALPGLRPIGRLLRLPPFVWVLDAVYPLSLKLRPKIQRLLRQKSA